MIERGHGEAAFETAIEALDGFTAKGIEAVFREYVLSHWMVLRPRVSRLFSVNMCFRIQAF